MDTEITTLNTEINVRHYNIIHPDHSDSVIMNEVVLPSVTVLFDSVYCVCDMCTMQIVLCILLECIKTLGLL